MIRHLPEGARYTSRRALELELMDKSERPPVTAEDEYYMDARTWTIERRLMAMFINAINQNTAATGQWQKGKTPDFPSVGPLDWDPKRKKRLEIKKQVSAGAFTTTDIMRALGWNG